MMCKKHGDIGKNYISFTQFVQPVIVNIKPQTELPGYEKALGDFCLECLTDLLRKKIGICKEIN